MHKPSPNAWKTEQREILRAAFGPAFTRYCEMVNKEDDPDTYRKYLEFIAKQVGLEEPTLKNGPHDGLATVQINIGQFHQSARALGSVPFNPAPVIEAEEIQELPAPEGPVDFELASQLASEALGPGNGDTTSYMDTLDAMLDP
jgi:hypothetical protein